MTAPDGTQTGGCGVLSVPAPTWEEQVTVAARTVRNNMTRYQAATGMPAVDEEGRVFPDFIAWLGNVYAPVGAENDPTALNENWIGGVMRIYTASALA